MTEMIPVFELTEIAAIFPVRNATRVVFKNGRKGHLLLPVEAGVVNICGMGMFKPGDPVLIAVNAFGDVTLITPVEEAAGGGYKVRIGMNSTTQGGVNE